MSPSAADYWQRAQRAFATARLLLAEDVDAAVSRAYYASFYAVSALFALEGTFFSRHTALKTAVHRDLAQSGRWPTELAKAYSILMDLRDTADYAGGMRVSQEDAQRAVDTAARILDAVRSAAPDLDEDASP